MVKMTQVASIFVVYLIAIYYFEEAICDSELGEKMLIGSHNIIKKCKHGTFLLDRLDDFISKHMDLFGEWEEQSLSIFLTIVKPGDIVIDAGANIGAFTVPLAKAVGPNGRVHAFEPQKVINQRLNANVAINELHNVDVYWNALSNAPGNIQVPHVNYSMGGNFGALSLVQASYNHSNVVYYNVSAVTLDSLNLFNPFTGSDCPTFIKLDVELMEKQVLEGGENLIRKCKPFIHAENNNIKTTAALVEQLYLMDYVPFWDINPTYDPEEVKGKIPDLEDKEIFSFNMLCVPKLLLESENLVMINFVRVERDKPFLHQYFPFVDENGNVRPTYTQGS